MDIFELTALYEKCSHKEDVTELREHFSSGANVDECDDLGWTPLMVGSQLGYTRVVRLLVDELQADVNGKNKIGYSALTYAAQGGHLDVTQVLLMHKAAIDSPDDGSPLIWAARRNHLPIVRCLVEAKASVDIRGLQNRTAKEWAQYEGNTQVYKYLHKVERPLRKQERRKLRQQLKMEKEKEKEKEKKEEEAKATKPLGINEIKEDNSCVGMNYQFRGEEGCVRKQCGVQACVIS